MSSMTNLLLFADQHGYGSGMVDWITHTVVSSLVFALINGFIFKLMNHLTLGEAAVLVVVVLLGLFVWGRARDGQRW